MPVVLSVLFAIASASADAWHIDASGGSSVELQDGRIHIARPLNHHAHVERPLGEDLITVSALMQPSTPAGVSWSAGVFLYWAPGAWCQLSIIDPGGGRYYTAE